MNLEEIIVDLIDKKHEGSYWDFKQEYHYNRAKMLHDIICMANNLADCDAYIIFGVTDDGDIVGIEEDKNRKNQENFITFLRDKSFNGGYRPEVELIELNLYGHIIDILIIRRSARTPYYLTNDFVEGKERVRAYYIYTRIMDTNTPRDRSADEESIELLWKKRFGLVPVPLQRFERYLKNKSHWIERGQTIYYDESPEFTVEIIDDMDSDLKNRQDNPEFYSYTMMNSSTRYETVHCKYLTTVLHSRQIVYLDGGRYVTPTPFWGFIAFDTYDRHSFAYKYFIQGTLDYELHLFLYDVESSEAKFAKRRFLEVVVVYKSEAEMDAFESYIKANADRIFNEITTRMETNLVHGAENERVRAIENERLYTGMIFNEKLKEFRKVQ